MSERFCKFFARGACLKGDQCEYSHDRKVCTFYQKGFCAYGSRCRYKHVNASQAQSSANGHQSLGSDSVVAHITRGTSSWVPKTTNLSPYDKCATGLQCKNQDYPRNSAVGESSTAIPSEHFFCTFSASYCPSGEKFSCIHGDQCLYSKRFCLHSTVQKEREKYLGISKKKEKYLQALKDSQEIECNICLDHVLSKPNAAERKFGVLPECNHAFCLSCIRNWRSSAPTSVMDVTNTNTVRTCPVCRKLSYYVIPSTIWYSTKEEKREIINNYKANCKLIDCKHFDSGNGNCPFGNSCFYKHSVKPGSYTWIHHRPPPPRRPNNRDVYDILDMLSQFDFENGEFDSIMRDSELFSDMDPFEIMDLAERMGDSGPSYPEESDDEEMDFLNLTAISEALDSGSDAFGPEELDSVEAALPSMILHSTMEEEFSDGDY